MNQFSYVIGVTRQVREGLVFWAEKTREYVNTYYQGDEENARGTDFYRGILKTRQIVENLFEKEEGVRSVFDDQNLLACVCIIQETSVLIEQEMTDCIEIESLANSPWNTIEELLPEKRKGAATTLIEGIILESRALGLSKIFKLMAITSAKGFYNKIGFEETNGSGEMLLNENQAAMFLLDLDQKRNSSTFD